MTIVVEKSQVNYYKREEWTWCRAGYTEKENDLFYVYNLTRRLRLLLIDR